MSSLTQAILPPYNQLRPWGHLVITDTPIIRTSAISQAKIIYRRLTEINSRYYGLSLMRTLTRGPNSVRNKVSWLSLPYRTLFKQTNKGFYSQLLPCGHLVIMDTPLIRTAAEFLAKTSDICLNDKLLLLRTYRHLSRSRQHNSIVPLTLVITNINQHLATFWQNYLRL